MAKKVTELNDESKAFLLSKTPYALPDNPSSKGFSAHQIKTAMYGGQLVLYEWLKRMAKESNAGLESLSNEIDSIRETSLAGGSEFVPALQGDEPNYRKTKVWLMTDEGEDSGDSEAEEAESLSFGDGGESPVFEEDDSPAFGD